MIKHIHNIPIIIGYTLICVLSFLTMENGFFWDTIQLGSQHADFYYQNNFSKLLLPNSIDSGHIPAFGMYLALMWDLFGRNLIVSHLSILPFSLGILWQLHRFLGTFIEKKYVGWAVLLVLIDPTLLSQMTLVSPDVPLIFFFLLSLNSIIKNQRFLLSLSIFCLFLISMRGMMVAFCLLSVDIYRNLSLKNSYNSIAQQLLSRTVLYLPAVVLFLTYNLYHYFNKGWIAFHDNSPWASSFEAVDLSGVLYNIALVGWRLLDFGRIGVWLIFIFLFFRFRKKIFQNKDASFPGKVTAVFLIILPLPLIWSVGLVGHRYLLPIYLLISAFTAYLLFRLRINEFLRNGIVAIWMIALSTGNLWVYPDTVSQGWDSTLAHLPYYNMRYKALNYIDNNEIKYDQVQTFFPNRAVIDDIELNKDNRNLQEYNNDKKYVLYSNVFNVSDKTYREIMEQYQLQKSFRKGKIFMNLYVRQN